MIDADHSSRITDGVSLPFYHQTRPILYLERYDRAALPMITYAYLASSLGLRIVLVAVVCCIHCVKYPTGCVFSL